MALESSQFNILMRLLLRLLPEDERKRARRRLLAILLLLLFAFGGLIGVQWIGPKANGPIEDPIDDHNRRAAALAANAADSYREALRVRSAPPQDDWKSVITGSSADLPPELTAWIDANAETVDLLREASSAANCLFPLERDERGMVAFPRLRSELSVQARFMVGRARVAIERHDLAVLTDSLQILAGMAHHAGANPGVVGGLPGIAVRGTAAGLYLDPFEWPELSASERANYIAATSDLLSPPQALEPAFDFERADLCWLVRTMDFGDGSWLVPHRRFFAEIDIAQLPYRRISRLPLERQTDPSDAVWQQVRVQERRSRSGWRAIANFPMCSASKLVGSLDGFYQLRWMLAATLRGLRTVSAVFTYRDVNGSWPGSLALITEVPADFVDPFSGQPFIYRRTAEGFTLYSVGADRDDDGGHHDPRFGYPKPRTKSARKTAKPDGDFVFWPLQNVD